MRIHSRRRGGRTVKWYTLFYIWVAIMWRLLALESTVYIASCMEKVNNALKRLSMLIIHPL